MREEFIKSIQDAVGGCARHWAEIITDSLIKKGAVLPPCKVGDHCLWDNEEWYITGITYFGEDSDFLLHLSMVNKEPCGAEAWFKEVTLLTDEKSKETLIKNGFKFDGETLRCRICGTNVAVKTAVGFILSSNSEGDEEKGICNDCLVEHCCNTDCSECDWYKEICCPHTDLKKILMEDQNEY